jgi:tRNA(fMet)-specific endonuclease VapC
VIYHLDSNIIIYFLKGQSPQLLSRFKQIPRERIKIPAIVLAEILYGIEKSRQKQNNLEKLNRFIMPFEVIPFNFQAAIEYAKIRAYLEKNGTPIGPNDLIIAATALANQACLVTHNVKEFERIPDLQIEDWTSLDNI